MSAPNNSQTCYLGLGSNLDNPIKQLHQAIRHISRLPKTQFIQSAAWYQSKAWGVTAQNDFINTVVKIHTLLAPLALLKAIKVIEYRLMQRKTNLKWHARKIDIDILLYGQRQLHRKELTIPHPFIAERDFVLMPLLELKPQLPIKIIKQLKGFNKSSTTHTSLKKVHQ